MSRERYDGTLFLVACGALLVCAATAFGADGKDPSGDGRADPILTADCDLTEHKMGEQVFSPAVTVPDNNATGISFGPIVLPADQMFVGHVVLELECTHTWIGDLIVRLEYDEDSDGAIDVASTVICRPGRTVSCGAGGAGSGCSSNFAAGAAYRFDDSATNPLPATGCASGTDIPAGCYRSTGLDTNPLSVFVDRVKGGRWWLFVSDNAVGDGFTMTRWAVHIQNSPVSAAPKSWGQIKLRYR